jgi:hypothetical protein
MKRTFGMGSMAQTLAGGVGLVAGAYASYAALAWSRYGHVSPPRPGDEDSHLDRFMPVYEVVERHHIHVAAPAAVTFAAARELDLFHRPLVRGIVRARELILGADIDDRRRPHGLLAEMQSLGWGVLDEIPDCEVIAGAVTKPWEPNVVFRAVAPDQFAGFHEPGYVKIAWTLRADPVSPTASIFRTERRAVATDAAARAKFRRYWSLLSPGIIVIRWAALRPLRAAAEGRALRTQMKAVQPGDR